MKATVKIGECEYIEHYVPDILVNDAAAHHTENFFGYDKALLGSFGAKLNPDTDAGLRTIPVLPEEDKALLLEGKAFDIRKSAFSSPRHVHTADELNLTYTREYMIGGNVIHQEVFKKTYDIDKPMVATHVTTFTFANALGYVNTALAVVIGEDSYAARETPSKSEREKQKSSTNWNPYTRAEENAKPDEEANRLVA